MKKFAGLLLIMICFTGVYSQVTLSFCASVEQNGYCNFNNTKFISQADSTEGRVFMQVKNTGAPIGANNLVFKIYSLDGAGKETYVTLLQQAIKPDWYFAWMPSQFNSPGKYVVRVYNETSQMICTNTFEFIPFK